MTRTTLEAVVPTWEARLPLPEIDDWAWATRFTGTDPVPIQADRSFWPAVSITELDPVMTLGLNVTPLVPPKSRAVSNADRLAFSVADRATLRGDRPPPVSVV